VDDLEVARRRAVRDDPRRPHDSALYRTPVTTLDAHLAAGRRIAALGDLLDAFVPEADAAADDALLAEADLTFGPPVLRPPSLRDFYAFEGHVRTMWARRGQEIPDAWFRLPIFYFSNVSEIRGPGDPVWAPRASRELDFELEVCAVIDTPVRDLRPNAARRRSAGTASSTTGRHETSSATRPPCGSGGQGQGLRIDDRTMDRHA
jgi:2-keto-4-pentenoate hydratase/2-oxohepta-3-ene-1,7-dioic acid hydratase in catechol pathway